MNKLKLIHRLLKDKHITEEEAVILMSELSKNNPKTVVYENVLFPLDNITHT